MSVRLKLTHFISLALLVGLTACGDATQPPTTGPAGATTQPLTTASRTTPLPTTVAVTTPAATQLVPSLTATVAQTTARPSTNAVSTTVAVVTATAPTSAATTTTAITSQSDAERGLVIFRNQGCANCHGGDKATGNLGPPLNNLTFPEEGLLRQVRAGAKPMPAFSPEKLPDGDVKLIYAYLTSLKP